MTGTTSTMKPVDSITAKCDATVNSGKTSPSGSGPAFYVSRSKCDLSD